MQANQLKTCIAMEQQDSLSLINDYLLKGIKTHELGE
jgi:hypothetical protein